VHLLADADVRTGHEEWTEVRPTRETVTLTPAARLLRLRVLDPTGAEVPRCWVDVTTYRGDTHLRGYGQEAEGAVMLGVSRERSYIEVREAKDAAGEPLNLAVAGAWVPPEAHDLTLRMEAGATMTGTVRTLDGRPVADAEVLAHRGVDVYARARTNAEGRYELVGLDPRAVRVQVKPPEGLAPPRPREVAPSTAGPSVDFTLPEVVPITVVDWRGRPVRGAWVRVKVIGEGPETGTYPIERHTNEDGVAHLANLYANQELHVMPQNSKDLASLRRPWNGLPSTLRLEQAHTVRVRVVDRSGPVSGAEIDVEEGWDLSPDTGPDGLAAVVVPYRPMRLRARRGASAPWSEWVHVTPHETEVEVRIPDAER
jgi:hypothetical protein